jgi:hypothetical protein
MRYTAGLLICGLAGAPSGCVDRVIVEQDTDGNASGSGSSSTDAGESTEDDPACQDVECGPNAACFEGTCVGTGELRISLSWNYVSDLDLHVITPTGVHISYENREAGGGILDVDDCVAGNCVNNTATHVENIFFPTQPPPGTYQVWVYNFDGERGGPFNIEVSGAASASFGGTLPSSITESQVFTFSL